MEKKYFGTDGIRGQVNNSKINEAFRYSNKQTYKN